MEFGFWCLGDLDHVCQSLDRDGASGESLGTDLGVLEGSGISGPLESTEGIGLDNGQVVKKVEDGPLLSSALAVGLGKGVTDQELAAIVIVGNGLEEGGKVDVSG